LVVVNTIFCGSVFRINSSEFVIGRTEDNDITIEHRSVSRHHAKVVREGDRVRVFDQSSANGILVNGEEIEAATLRSGDIVELGRVRLRYVPIGEKFSVTPEEIERARIADVAGEELEGDGASFTNPGRTLSSRGMGRQNAPLLVAIAALIVLVGVAAVVIARSFAPSEVAPDTSASTHAAVIAPVAAHPPPVAAATNPMAADAVPTRTPPEPAPVAPPPGDANPAQNPTSVPPAAATDSAATDAAATDADPADATPPAAVGESEDPPEPAVKAGDRPDDARRTPPPRRRRMSRDVADEKLEQAQRVFLQGKKAECATLVREVARDYPSLPAVIRLTPMCKP
jgi:hypothetical protein